MNVIQKNDSELQIATFYCVSQTPLNIKHGRQNNVSHCHYSLVIVGGDGTMNEIINGLLQRKQRDCGVDVNDKTAVLNTIDIPIAIIPAGKTNRVLEDNVTF